jgi:hypothetical protein
MFATTKPQDAEIYPAFKLTRHTTAESYALETIFKLFSYNFTSHLQLATIYEVSSQIFGHEKYFAQDRPTLTNI